MSVIDDLKAARALIDTPEKFASELRSVEGVIAQIAETCYEATGVGLAREKAMADAISLALDVAFHGRQSPWGLPHADIMALFDRAIKELEPA